jgi:chitodextrinase
MYSTSYLIEWDTVSTGGAEDHSSSSYILRDTLGNAGAGNTNSVTYDLRTGYRQGVEDQASASASNGGGGGSCSDATPPVISEISISEITDESALVTWSTNESGNSEVRYGKTAAYEIGSELDTRDTTSHSVRIKDLFSATEYHIQVSSTDSCNNKISSDDVTFVTVDVSACEISNVEVTNVNETSATIVWTTDEASIGEIEYGESVIYDTLTPDDAFDTSHSVTLANLAEATSYHFRVTCEDASQNIGNSSDETFTTLRDNPPENVSELSASEGDGSCNISWKNPPDEDLAGVLALQCEENYSTSPTDADCTETFRGLAENFTNFGLTNGTTYFYGLFAYDDAGQFASGALVSCEPRQEAVILPTEEVPEEEPPKEEPAEEGKTVEAPSEEAIPGDITGEEGVKKPIEGAEDGGRIEVPPTTVEEEARVPASDVSFLVEEGMFELEVRQDGSFFALPASSLTVLLASEHIEAPVDHVLLLVGENAYLMSEGEDTVVAGVKTPHTSGAYAVIIVIFYEDGTSQTLRFLLEIVEQGFTYEIIDESGVRVGASDVTLTFPSGDTETLTTDMDGTFSWYAPNGTYRLEAVKDGYDRAIENITTKNGIINPRVLLSRKTGVAKMLEGILPAAAEEWLEKIRDVPGVKETTSVAIPVIAVAAAASAIVLTVAFDLVPLLQYLFTSPALFFWRRKRKTFGVVYNAYSKIPLDLAIVRLYRVSDTARIQDHDRTQKGLTTPAIQSGSYRVEEPKTGLIRTKVTDKQGRFHFLIQPGTYRLVVTKAGFVFPSQYLLLKKEEEAFLDVYHGEAIHVTAQDAVITPNIPLDPVVNEHRHEPGRIIWMRRFRRAQQWTAIAGNILAMGVLLVQPSFLTLALSGIQIIVYLLIRRLVSPRKPKSWGIVYDKDTGRPLKNAVVRIFEPRYHKLLETSVTDGVGRYTFLLGPSSYESRYEKTGYKTVEIKPIDFTKQKETVELATDVGLSSEEQPQESSNQTVRPKI